MIANITERSAALDVEVQARPDEGETWEFMGTQIDFVTVTMHATGPVLGTVWGEVTLHRDDHAAVPWVRPGTGAPWMLQAKAEALRLLDRERKVELRTHPRPGFDDCTDEEFLAAVAAPMDAVCASCPHTKAQHYSAGPRCAIDGCPCRRYLVGS